MLKQKLLFTLLAVAAVTLAAVASDFIVNTYINHTPLGFTPFNTALIASVVGSPLTYFLISQRIDIQKVKEALSRSIAEKDLAATEIQLRRQQAEQAQADAEGLSSSCARAKPAIAC